MNSNEPIENFHAALDGWCRENRISIFKLARLCERSERYFYDARRRATMPAMESLRRAALILHQPLMRLLLAAGRPTETELYEYLDWLSGPATPNGTLTDGL